MTASDFTISTIESMLPTLTLGRIARLITKDWKKVHFAAVPYLNAMFDLASTADNYGADSGDSIVRYFLSNANSWRGPIAKLVKAELKRRLI